MKRSTIWVVALSIMLATVMLLTFTACGNNKDDQKETTPGETTAVSKFDSGDGWPEVAKPLSWEEINKFPIKSSDMSIADARQLCVDFFRYTKTAVWIPSESFTYWHDYGKTREFTMEGSKLYGGLPYISMASGSIYRLMDYMDEETGVVDMKAASGNPAIFGNQCSFGAWWGWGRVINSADYNWTENMYEDTGFLKVGDYTYGQSLVVGWSDGYGTDEVLAANGPEKMYECYAKLKAADGVVYWTDAGHVVMISEDAKVVYMDDGVTIDPEKSYVTVIDQVQTWTFDTNDAGDKYERMNRVDGKLTFDQLYKGAYMPFTFAEWTGADPIEETVNKYSHSGETITVAQLFSSTVESNYGISDIYAFIYDSKGNEVCKIANHVEVGGQMKLKFAKGAAYIWGSCDDLNPADGYTVKIVAQLATGERPTLWEGKLA